MYMNRDELVAKEELDYMFDSIGEVKDALTKALMTKDAKTAGAVQDLFEWWSMKYENNERIGWHDARKCIEMAHSWADISTNPEYADIMNDKAREAVALMADDCRDVERALKEDKTEILVEDLLSYLKDDLRVSDDEIIRVLWNKCNLSCEEIADYFQIGDICSALGVDGLEW